MFKIAIIGWYGTETIGDRAILAGLIAVLSRVTGRFSVRLGSIHPFFSERTLMEDEAFLRGCAGEARFDISLFDSTIPRELSAAVKWSDLLVVGGGPLMGIPSMFMLEYAFAKARRLGRKSMILGCGVGPMRKRIYEKSLVNLAAGADASVFRDETSLREYRRLARQDAGGVAAIDPAVFAAMTYGRRGRIPDGGMILACLREFPSECGIHAGIDGKRIDAWLENFILKLRAETGKELLLLPMHYFEIGGDDRRFLNRLARRANDSGIAVQNEPVSLQESLRLMAEASQCVGMRFHSVVLQTMLNGNNVILDYTDPRTGKTGGFLRQINASAFYEKSYFALQAPEEGKTPEFPESGYVPDWETINVFLARYVETINLVLEGKNAGHAE